MAVVVRVRVDVRLGAGTAHQRLPVEVAEVPCVLRPCLTVDVGPRRTGDPPVRCTGLSRLCPGAAPPPDPGLAKARGVGRNRAVEVCRPVEVAELVAQIDEVGRRMDGPLAAILGAEEDG